MAWHCMPPEVDLAKSLSKADLDAKESAWIAKREELAALSFERTETERQAQFRAFISDQMQSLRLRSPPRSPPQDGMMTGYPQSPPGSPQPMKNLDSFREYVRDL